MARIMALDLGSVRTGVALSDPTHTIATPTDVPAGSADGREFADQIRELVVAHDVERVIVGIPSSLDGSRGPMAYWAEGIRRMLASDLGVPVDPWDERFSSDEAARRLKSAGISSRDMRRHIDSAAAAVVLQEYLESQRSNGNSTAGPAPGR